MLTDFASVVWLGDCGSRRSANLLRRNEERKAKCPHKEDLKCKSKQRKATHPQGLSFCVNWEINILPGFYIFLPTLSLIVWSFLLFWTRDTKPSLKLLGLWPLQVGTHWVHICPSWTNLNMCPWRISHSLFQILLMSVINASTVASLLHKNTHGWD